MASSPSAELSLQRLAEIAVSSTARVDLSRVVSGEHEGALVAVKRLHDDAASDPQLATMFRDEIWMASSVVDEHVVRVLGWGQDADGPYFAAEFVRGVSIARLLRTVIQTGEMFSERLIVYLASCISKGLAAAHAVRAPTGELLNLVHRDLTPANVLVGFDGEVKITDLGLAKAKRRSSKTITGLIKGTRDYMAPEQIQSRHIDSRLDIFSLGVMLFELSCGQRPWQGKNARDTMRLIVEAPPPDLNTVRPGFHSVLVNVVLRCLAKDPADRYQTAAELDQELTQWLQNHGYHENQEHLARFVRRNAMRQMRWCERAIAGEFMMGASGPAPLASPWANGSRTGSEEQVGSQGSASTKEPSAPAQEATATRVDVPTSSTERSFRLPDGEVTDVTQPPSIEPMEAPTLIQRPKHVAVLVPPRPAERAGAACGQPPVEGDASALAAQLSAEAEVAATSARRAAELARQAAQEAQAAAACAEVSATAAAFAHEAVGLAASGDAGGARERLAQAQQLRQDLEADTERGGAPGGSDGASGSRSSRG